MGPNADMGLIVTGLILKGGETEALKRLMYVTQDLPTLAKALAKLKVWKLEAGYARCACQHRRGVRDVHLDIGGVRSNRVCGMCT